MLYVDTPLGQINEVVWESWKLQDEKEVRV
jgi:hypothetical protein